MSLDCSITLCILWRRLLSEPSMTSTRESIGNVLLKDFKHCCTIHYSSDSCSYTGVIPNYMLHVRLLLGFSHPVRKFPTATLFFNTCHTKAFQFGNLNINSQIYAILKCTVHPHQIIKITLDFNSKSHLQKVLKCEIPKAIFAVENSKVCESVKVFNVVSYEITMLKMMPIFFNHRSACALIVYPVCQCLSCLGSVKQELWVTLGV